MVLVLLHLEICYLFNSIQLNTALFNKSNVVITWSVLLLTMICTITVGKMLWTHNRVHILFQKQISRTFPGLRLIFQDSKIHINPFTPKISVLILLTVCHIFHIFYLSLTDFQNSPEPVAFFPGLSSPGK